MPMDLKLLPRIAHASVEDDPPPLPDTFTAVRNHESLVQPYYGTWCSPVTASSAEGAPIKTIWTECCETQEERTGLPSAYLDKCRKLTEVEPQPGARIYLIDTADDLDWLVAEYPLPDGHQMRRTAPNWEGMAASGWDAVYASEAGLTATADRIPLLEPSLGRWDCPSLLWLRPAYRLTTL